MNSTLAKRTSPRPDVSTTTPELLHELFEAQAEACPDRIAVECSERRMTYDELDWAANRLAGRLRARGVGRGCFVAMLLPRSIEVYVALLGIMKAGAAYVPLDPDYPEDRVSYILDDVQAHTLITTRDLAGRRGAFAGGLLLIDSDHDELVDGPVHGPMRGESGVGPGDLCYVIYTSGSTGRPKGVMIEHRAACNLVRAEGTIFQVEPEDRVFQGFSIAFDASVEEVWLAFHAGATLVVGTNEMIHSGPALAAMLTDAWVSVLSTVPTLLSMIEDDLPKVRLLILGGESCPQDLVARWCRPGRRMVNTYGPTEATVIATYSDCDPGKPVAIGRAVPGYTLHILDPERNPVPIGATGELHIGGVGLARGYVGRDDLTRRSFVADPFDSNFRDDSRLYKTGDLARLRDDGEIEFMGRADDQVKLRGFRVELSEIESVLIQCPGVLAAAVAVREDVPGIPHLIGYVIPRAGAVFDEDRIKSALRLRLPSYMIPALLDEVDELPTLPSGKVDRKALPAPSPRRSRPNFAHVAARTEVEARIAEVWETLFAPASVSMTDDFFLDLGGHSLLAARMVSELRSDPRLQDLSIIDVYNHPTIEGLAEKQAQARRIRMDTISDPAEDADASDETDHPWPSPVAHVVCGAAQLAGLYFILGFFSLQWLAPYLTYTWMIDQGHLIGESILAALSSLIVLYPAMLLATIAVKWIVIGRYKAGSYPLWGTYYFRWWFVQMFQTVVPVSYMAGTPLLNLYYRLMGARIGANVYLGSDNVGTHDLISIGDDSSIGSDSSLAGYTVEAGMLRLEPIGIGRGCFVGTRSVLQEGSEMEDGAKLDDLSLLPRGSKVPSGQRWAGSPARRASETEAIATADRTHARASLRRRFAYGILHGIGLLVFPIFVIAAIFPGMIVMNSLGNHLGSLLLAPLVALSFIVLLCLEIALVKRVLLGKVEAGHYPLHRSFYIRKWFVDQLMELSLDVLGPLYSTIYLAPWYRLLGAKLGKRAEVSTASFISPDLLSIGDEGFIADCVSLGASRVEDGLMTIGPIRIGKRSFIGNSAMLPPGAVIGDNCLIGCLSAPPSTTVEDGTSWLGSPAVFLPQRQGTTAFSEESTFRPTRKLQAQRAAIELVRVLLPSTCFIALTSVLLAIVSLLREAISFWQLLLVFPILYAACGVAAAAIVIALKWALMGRYRPCEQPLWSTFVWRTELVTAMHENLSDLFLVGMLSGTPFIAWFFRLLGARIGKRPYLETTQFTEYDLVSIGDDCALNHDSTIQTHLFEDRVMKMSRIEIGDRCTVGSLSLVLYDTRIEAGASLGDLSLLMKGEVLPASTSWEGIPASRRRVNLARGRSKCSTSIERSLTPLFVSAPGKSPR